MLRTQVRTVRRSHGDSVALLSWGLVIGAVAQVILGFAFAAAEEPQSSSHALATAVNVAQHLLLLGGVYAAALMGIAGRGRWARFGYPTAALSILVLCMAEVWTLVDMEVANPLFGVASLGMMAGLTAAGVGAVRARVLAGRDRFTLFATGALVPVTIVGVALPGLWLHYTIGAWGLTFLWLGIALVRFHREDGQRAPTPGN